MARIAAPTRQREVQDTYNIRSLRIFPEDLGGQVGIEYLSKV